MALNLTPDELTKLLAVEAKKRTKGPTEEEREARMLAWFDEHLGPGDEVALNALLMIAKGTGTWTDTDSVDRNGMPQIKLPSYGVRIAAWDLLMTRHRGRPTQKVEVTTKQGPAQRWDPDKLELEDLRELKRLKEKSEAVDAEFTVTEDVKK